jgi:hypothetical protein
MLAWHKVQPVVRGVAGRLKPSAGLRLRRRNRRGAERGAAGQADAEPRKKRTPSG